MKFIVTAYDYDGSVGRKDTWESIQEAVMIAERYIESQRCKKVTIEKEKDQ